MNRKSNFSEPIRGRFFRAPEQPWRVFERLGDLKKQCFQTWKKSLFRLKRRFFRNWKGTLSLRARTTFTQFRAKWRPEKPIFPNLKEIAFSVQKTIFRYLKDYAFSGNQNNLDAISSDLATWKNEFSKPGSNRFFSSKDDFSEPERLRFFREAEQPWRNLERLGDLKKRFFLTSKKLIYEVKRRFSEPWKGTLFQGATTTLTLFRASWRTKKAIFPYLKEIASFSSKSDFSVSE